MSAAVPPPCRLAVAFSGIVACGVLVSALAPASGHAAPVAAAPVAAAPVAGGPVAGVDDSRCGSRAVARSYATNLPPLATVGGVSIAGGGYGSALVAVPGAPGQFYGLTDRGPNVYGPDGEDVPTIKVEPLPDFAPSIGRFRLTCDGRAELTRRIVLRDAEGTAYSGRINTQAGTGETILGLDGNPLPADVNGYDPEGLAVARDGTFWVSDEYGPFVTHFDARGRQLARLSPLDGTLPAELAKRKPNRGMEGLTITPDGQTLVGIMQSALQQPDLAVPPASVAPVRIVTHHVRTGETHEYLYLLDDPKATQSVATEITALSTGTFLVNERDELYPPTSTKALWRIDLAGATDVGPHATVAGATYDAARGGLLFGGATIESLVGDQDAATAAATLARLGIAPVAKRPFLDINALLTSLDPTGAYFSHDKLEGVAVLGGGRTVVLSNDSDFGIGGVLKTAPPYQLTTKTSPVTGAQDDGEFLVVDVTRLPAAVADHAR